MSRHRKDPLRPLTADERIALTRLSRSPLRLKGRRGPKKAAVAVAASILTTVYHMLRDGTCYQDLGPNYFARRNPARTARTLADRIRSLGSIVEIRSAASSIQIEFLGRTRPRACWDSRFSSVLGCDLRLGWNALY